MSATRTSKADYNYLSLTPEGATLFAGSDHAVPTAMPPDTNAIIRPPNPSEYSAILKLSRREDTKLLNANISQGQENVIDCNSNCSRVIITGQFGDEGQIGDQVITVKGGCWRISIHGEIYSKGKRADVCVGVWSDQSHNTSSMLDFSGLFRPDGEPVTFILSRVNSPIMAALGRPKDIILPKNAKVLFWASIADQCYYWLKFAALKLHLLPSK